MGPNTPPERLPYAKALASGQGAMLVAVHIVHQTTTDNKQDGSVPHVYQNDLPGKVTKLVGELAPDGLDAIAKVVNHVGPQPAQGISVIAREARQISALGHHLRDKRVAAWKAHSDASRPAPCITAATATGYSPRPG